MLVPMIFFLSNYFHLYSNLIRCNQVNRSWAHFTCLATLAFYDKNFASKKSIDPIILYSKWNRRTRKTFDCNYCSFFHIAYFFLFSVFSWRSWTRNVGVMFVFSCCKLSISFLRISEMRPQSTICCQITMSIRLLFTNLTFLTKKLWLTTFHSSKLCLSGKNNLYTLSIINSHCLGRIY